MDIRIVLCLGGVVVCGIFTVHGQTELCHEALIKNLPDDHLTASSSRSDNTVVTSPVQGRINSTEQNFSNGTTLFGAWAPANDERGQYIQATFDEMTMITEIQTQGRNQGNDHVTMYEVEYTEDGKTWKTLVDDINVEQLFMGNSDGDSVQTNELPCPIFARAIRIVPQEWDKHAALRFEVNGCYVDNSVRAIATTLASTPSLLTTQTPPFLPGIVTPFGLMTPIVTTQNPQTTSLLTLIHWYITHSTSPATVSTMLTTPTTALTTPTTPLTTATTTQDQFLPGIQNPFGPGAPLIG